MFLPAYTQLKELINSLTTKDMGEAIRVEITEVAFRLEAVACGLTLNSKQRHLVKIEKAFGSLPEVFSFVTYNEARSLILLMWCFKCAT